MFDDPTRSHRPGDHDATRTGALAPGTQTNPTHVTRANEQERLTAELEGLSVPGFEISGVLGSGSFGVVYRAKQVGLNRVVALKMLIAGPFASPALRARFLLEAESVAALEHPGIVRVFAFGEHAGHPYLAMEFVPGGTLADRVRGTGPLAAGEATALVEKLAGAVAHAHSRGVVHRDIKPGNVLLTAEGEPRLTDFGLAKVGRSDMTVTGQILGTPAYMSPEQAAGKVHEVGTAADVYALGAVLYDVLTGRPPFVGDSAAVTLQKVLTEEPARPRKLNGAVPRDLETICLKCLEKDPAKRYPTAPAVADDLRRYMRGEPINARATPAWEYAYRRVRRHPLLSVMVATTLAAIIAVIAVLGESNARIRAKERETNEGYLRETALRYKLEEALQRAAAENREAIAARNEVQRKSDELTRALAKALLGPLTARNRGKPLTPYETEVFWRLAELRRDATALLFLEEATRTPLACEQLECRTEYALHAAIGLDLERRRTVDRLMLDRLREQVARGDRSTGLVVSMLRGQFTYPGTATDSPHALAEALARESESAPRIGRAVGLVAAVAGAERTEVGRTVRFIVDALTKDDSPTARWALGECLVWVAETNPEEAFRANSLLRIAAEQETDPTARSALVGTRWALLTALSGVGRERAPTARDDDLRGEADATLHQFAKEMQRLASLRRGDLDDRARADLARFLDPWVIDIRGDGVPSRRELAEIVALVPLGLSHHNRHHCQCAALVTGAFAAPHNVVPALALFHPDVQPPPRPLPPQDLVDLLKHPFCINEARRAVLASLAFTYKRPFRDQWEFVEYAQKHQPQLDLLTPPKRPEPKS